MAKIAVLCNFQEFLPGYSLTGIVKDQVRMLSQFGNDVHLFVNERYKSKEGDVGFGNATFHKAIPFAHLHDFRSMEELGSPDFKAKGGQDAKYYTDLIDRTEAVLEKELADGFEVAFTHDFAFTGWNMPYGEACVRVGWKLKHQVRWMHWIHSVPSGTRDWWNIPTWGPMHRLIYPNAADRMRVAECYKGKAENVRVVPHIKDIRSWEDLDDETCEFLAEFPAVMQADVVQVYPASVDRLEAKRVREVLLIFSKMKALGRSVCLVLANQWATGLQQKQDVDKYKKIAMRNGLTVGEEVIFTSDWKMNEKGRGKYDVGLPKHILRGIERYMNLFIFPTREESFGLVLPEASLTSGCLCVLNKSLQQQIEISGFTTLYFDFGSFSHNVNYPQGEEVFLQDVARIILGRMEENECLKTRTFFRQRNNWDYLYKKYYAGLISESRTWVV